MISTAHGLLFPARKRNRPLFVFTFCIAVMFVLISCDSDDDDAATPLRVQLQQDATVGSYLADADGRTLYSFANDFNNQNNCAGNCANLWPIYYAGDNLTQEMLPAGLDVADFGSITTTGGEKQSTYKSWPLYYYAPVTNGANTPEPAGQLQGEGIAGFWHVAKPDYTIRLMNAQLVGLDGKNYTNSYVEGTGKTLFFSDAKGATLYTFTVDKKNQNNFTAADFSNNNVWPIYETDKVVVPSTLDETLFGSITVFGKKQLTYNGWPLYYFGADAGVRGATKGVSVPTPGIWPVAVAGVDEAPEP